MFDDTILEPIRKAILEAKRDYKNILHIHVTHDFYLRVKAKCAPPVPDIQKPSDYPILGHSVKEHFEPCEKEWWLEFENAPPGRAVGAPAGDGGS
ncbi:MAG: hypothetical protein EHM40_11090 [Chloroflexi bacterium]|nr:MAG: hypothetical protein EHM40_11090 [Chloroflexota bacterium]